MTTPSAGFDQRRFKSIEKDGFNRIAQRYADSAHLRAGLQQALLELAAPAPGERVLDLAAGPGLLARDALPRVAPGGWVVASDIAESMLRVGLDAARAEGQPSLLAASCDAEHLAFAEDSFDLVLVGLGLFILPSPERALAEVLRVLRPGGRLVLSVWGPRDAVPLIACAQACIARLLPPPKVERPSVFRLGQPEALAPLIASAGFARVQTQGFSFENRFAQAQDYWQAFLDLAGGATEALSRLPTDTRESLRTGVATELQPYQTEEGYQMRSQVLLAQAWKPQAGA